MAISAVLSVQVYERTLYQPYSLHMSRNSSEILAGSQKARDLVTSIVQPTLAISSSLFIFLAIMTTMFLIEPFIALSAFLGFGFIYAGVVSTTKRRIAKNSQIIALQQGRVTRAIQEGLGGIRDVLIDGTQQVYSKLYKDALIPLQRAIADNQVVAVSPRYIVEALGTALIACLAYGFSKVMEVSGGLINAIPILGTLVLGAQRLLPVLQQIYSSCITINGNQASIQDALDLLDQPMPEEGHARTVKPMAFQFSIVVESLSFRYTPNGPWVLRNFDLEILKGSRVGFIGVTGSGKSTLLDVVMGLLAPTEGSLRVDNTTITPKNARAWQAHISHVPQAIFLSDTSIAENIAFGVSPQSINIQLVKQAAEQAQIAQTVESWSSGYDTLVGERGIRLSGGQRQRIGIARALYRQANVIIFDEATSALDNETEAAVMQAVETLNRDITVLIIAHRLTTLKSCDRVVELSGGGIKTIGTYEQMIRRAA